MADMIELRSPLQAQVVQWQVAPGDAVAEGDVVVILEAMKMEHEVRAAAAGRVRRRATGACWISSRRCPPMRSTTAPAPKKDTRSAQCLTSRLPR